MKLISNLMKLIRGVLPVRSFVHDDLVRCLNVFVYEKTPESKRKLSLESLVPSVSLIVPASVEKILSRDNRFNLHNFQSIRSA